VGKEALPSPILTLLLGYYYYYYYYYYVSKHAHPESTDFTKVNPDYESKRLPNFSKDFLVQRSIYDKISMKIDQLF